MKQYALKFHCKLTYFIVWNIHGWTLFWAFLKHAYVHNASQIPFSPL